MSSKIKILYNEYCETTREANYDDPWDADDVYWSQDIIGLSKKADPRFNIRENYEEMTIPFEVDDSSSYYLLYAKYSTGDSFHREEGRIDFICLFETEEKAKKAEEILWSASNYSTIIELEDGTEYNYCMPWCGYFETLESVNVDVVRVIE